MRNSIKNLRWLMPVMGMMGVLLLAGTAQAADEPYLQLEARIVNEPYEWLLPNGELIHKGLSNAAAQVQVQAQEGHQDYVLQMLWGRFAVKVPPHCWQGPPAAFAACVSIGPREDSQWQELNQQQSESLRMARQKRKNAYVSWALDDMPLLKAQQVITRTLADQPSWRRSAAGQQDPSTFTCVRLMPELARAPTQQALPRQGLLRGDMDAVAEYVQAARGGNWRAVGALFDVTLEDEQWESAQVLAAWLLQRGVPAGYNKLSLLIQAQSDGERRGKASSLAVSAQLQWRAAQSGDPVAQWMLATKWKEAGNPVAAQRLYDCAIAQNPALAR